jgi:hypothetical protein
MASTLDSPTWAVPDARRDFAAAATAQAESREVFRARFTLGLFLFGIVGVTFLQKIGYVTGTGSAVPIVLPMVIGGFLLACIVLRPVFDPLRIALYVAAMAATGLASILFNPTYSPASLMLLVALYLPMIVAFEATEATYRRCMNAYVTIMLFFCGIVALEHCIQFMVSPRAWPDLDKLLPLKWLIPGYNYLQSIIWSLPYHKPNALVFLEVSFLSQYIALALAIEIALFQRPGRIAILAAALMATFAGTGVLLMALTLPVLLGRLTIRQMIMVISALTIISWVAFRIGWFDIVSERMGEYRQSGTSANMRFIEPFDRLIKFLAQGNPLFGGIGAGKIEKHLQWWPFTKATVEYGLIPAVTFYAFFLYSLFKNAAYRSIAFTLAVWYTFEGALLTAINPLTCVLLSTMFLVRRGRERSDEGPVARAKIPVLPFRKSPASGKIPRSAAGLPQAAARALRERSSPRAPAVVDQPDPVPAIESPVPTEAITIPGTDGRLIYAVGDVHGRADLLAPLIERIAEDARRSPPADGRRPMIVFLGDYVDRGRRSREVIDQILALRERPEFEVRALLGNHEEAMLAYLDGRSSGLSFGRYGGQATLASYGVDAPTEGAGKEEWEAARPAFRDAVPPSHVEFLRELELLITVGDCVFVHAGLRAGVPLERQSRRDMLYIREEFFRAPVDCGKFIIHGHTPGETVFGAPGRLCLDTGAYASGILTAARFDGTAPQLLQTAATAVQ